MIQSKWLQLSGEKRRKLGEIHDFKKTDDAKVVDDKVISDGVSESVLEEVFSVEKLQELTGSDSEDQSELFDELVAQTFDGKPKPEKSELGKAIKTVKKTVKKAVKTKSHAKKTK